MAKITNLVRLLSAASRRNFAELALADRFCALRGNRIAPASTAPLLAVGAPMDAVYYAILGQIVSTLRTRHGMRVEQVCTQVMRHGASQSLRHFLRARLDYNILSARKWERLYGIFCDRVGYRAATWSNPVRAFSQWRQAWRIWRSLSDKDQLATLSHQNIVIGDLVIDTYLRLRPTTTIALKDWYLLAVIRQAVKDVDAALVYFQRARPVLFFSIYSTYLAHGIPARVALACGVKVLTFGNMQEFCTALTSTHIVHTKDAARYSDEFDAMPNQAEKADQAALALEARLSGHIDPAMAYMKKSAYAQSVHEVPDVRGATIVFLHDFYDSVHVYPWILFHDFWEWVCFTIEALQASGRDFWIKPHPNQSQQSSAEIAWLRRKYPDAKFLATNITNRQLADSGMDCAVTVYGSVAPEIAFLGIPSISSGDSPHASFDAFYLARTRADYAALLSNRPLPGANPERLKMQACAFYYMHNLNLDSHGALLRDRFAAVWAHLMALNPNDCFDTEKTSTVLSDLTDNAAFERFSASLFSTNPS